MTNFSKFQNFQILLILLLFPSLILSSLPSINKEFKKLYLHQNETRIIKLKEYFSGSDLYFKISNEFHSSYNSLLSIHSSPKRYLYKTPQFNTKLAILHSPKQSITSSSFNSLYLLTLDSPHSFINAYFNVYNISDITGPLKLSAIKHAAKNLGYGAIQRCGGMIAFPHQMMVLFYCGQSKGDQVNSFILCEFQIMNDIKCSLKENDFQENGMTMYMTYMLYNSNYLFVYHSQERVLKVYKLYLTKQDKNFIRQLSARIDDSSFHNLREFNLQSMTLTSDNVIQILDQKGYFVLA